MRYDGYSSWLIVVLGEQAELRGIARRFGKPEMAEGMAGQQPPARGALHEALLDQERLDDLLDGVARLGQRRRDSLDADRAAAVVFRDHGQIAPVHGVEPGGVDLERAERAVGDGAIDG